MVEIMASSWQSKAGAVAGGLVGGTAGFFASGFNPYGLVAGATLGASAGEKKIGGTSKIWDTTIGREGLVGWIGDATGLWDSGTTADAKRKAVSGVEGMMAEAEDRHDIRKTLMAQQLNNKIFNTNQKAGAEAGGLLNTGNIATDTSRTENVNRTITNAVNMKNEQMFESHLAKLNAEDSHQAQMATYDAQISNIENS